MPKIAVLNWQKDWSIWDADQVLKNKAGQTIYQGKLPYIYAYPPAKLGRWSV